MAVEHGHQGRRGLYASWVQAGVAAGMILASGVFGCSRCFPRTSFLAWGWRVPFLPGSRAARDRSVYPRACDGDPAVRSSPGCGEAPDAADSRGPADYPRNVLLAMGARCGENASFYIITVFVLTYATATLPSGTLTEAEISALKLAKRSLILQAVLIGSMFQFIAIPLLGWLSDLWGRRKVLPGGYRADGSVRVAVLPAG